MWLKSSAMMFLWFTRFFAYFGMQFNLSDLGTKVALNFTTMGLAEVLASLSSAYVKRTMKRKISMQLSLLVCASAIFANHFFDIQFLAALSSLS